MIFWKPYTHNETIIADGNYLMTDGVHLDRVNIETYPDDGQMVFLPERTLIDGPEKVTHYADITLPPKEERKRDRHVHFDYGSGEDYIVIIDGRYFGYDNDPVYPETTYKERKDAYVFKDVKSAIGVVSMYSDAMNFSIIPAGEKEDPRWRTRFPHSDSKDMIDAAIDELELVMNSNKKESVKRFYVSNAQNLLRRALDSTL